MANDGGRNDVAARRPIGLFQRIDVFPASSTAADRLAARNIPMQAECVGGRRSSFLSSHSSRVGDDAVDILDQSESNCVVESATKIVAVRNYI